MDIQALLMNKSGIRKRKAQIFISKKRKEKHRYGLYSTFYK